MRLRASIQTARTRHVSPTTLITCILYLGNEASYRKTVKDFSTSFNPNNPHALFWLICVILVLLYNTNISTERFLITQNIGTKLLARRTLFSGIFCNYQFCYKQPKNVKVTSVQRGLSNIVRSKSLFSRETFQTYSRVYCLFSSDSNKPHLHRANASKIRVTSHRSGYLDWHNSKGVKQVRG